MKRTSIAITAFISAIIILAGCTKEDKTNIDPSKGTLYEIIEGSNTEYCLGDIGRKVEEYVPGGVEWIVERLKGLGISGIDRLPEIIKDNTIYGSCIMKYRSSGNHGEEEWLTGRLYYPLARNGETVLPEHILIACHHTIGSNAQAPSAGIGLEAAMAANKGLVIVPDYLGYGSTSSIDHPYCIPEQTAINVTDMLLASMEYYNRLNMPIKGLPVYCEGYSQGGQAALAVVRYTQQNPHLPRLKKTICGGGPYSIDTMFNKWLESGKCSYPFGILATLTGLKACFPHIVTGSFEDYFSDELLKSGLLEKFFSKEYSNGDLNKDLLAMAGEYPWTEADIHKLLSDEATDKTSQLYKQIQQACRQCELTEGWDIQSPVAFLHANDDEIVDYVNFELAEKNLKNSYTTFETLDYPIFSGHILNGAIFYARIICGEYLK